MNEIEGVLQDPFRSATPQMAARRPGVLVADDEPAIREVLKPGLQQEGFAVWLAADGREAMDLYTRHVASIDVVLLDVRMPHLDGPATLVAIHCLTPQIPCCFMSGDLGHFTEVGLLGRGARLVIRKPFRVREVARLLRDVIERPCFGPADPVASHAAEAAGTNARVRAPG